MVENSGDSAPNPLWAGRFQTGAADVMEALNVSIDTDMRFAAEDIAGSKAHAAMLAACEIISAEDEAKIQHGLDLIASEVRDGTFPARRVYEDIHMNVEARLFDLIGSVAGRLHTARSRNDQVATDFRLWLRNTLDQTDIQLGDLQRALAHQAKAHADAVMPGFTHMQNAQPITFGHHCLCYVEMLNRDRGRFQDARTRLNECPLGAAALAGTSFPIDREMTATALGFERPMDNSLDAVSARDFALEALAAASITAAHLSRLAEEIVIWCSEPFSFIVLSDEFSTGSSIMPQKRNPDAAELVRAKAGRIAGAFQSLMIVIKGLPLAYSKDLQEDKPLVFDAFDALQLSLTAMTGIIADMTPDRARMAAAAEQGFSDATDLADWLVRVKHMSFRDAHALTAKAVEMAATKGRRLAQMPVEEMAEISSLFTQEAVNALGAENSVRSRRSYGGTSPDLVAQAAKRWLSGDGKLGR